MIKVCEKPGAGYPYGNPRNALIPEGYTYRKLYFACWVSCSDS